MTNKTNMEDYDKVTYTSIVSVVHKQMNIAHYSKDERCKFQLY